MGGASSKGSSQGSQSTSNSTANTDANVNISDEFIKDMAKKYGRYAEFSPNW